MKVALLVSTNSTAVGPVVVAGPTVGPPVIWGPKVGPPVIWGASAGALVGPSDAAAGASAVGPPVGPAESDASNVVGASEASPSGACCVVTPAFESPPPPPLVGGSAGRRRIPAGGADGCGAYHRAIGRAEIGNKKQVGDVVRCETSPFGRLNHETDSCNTPSALVGVRHSL